MDQQQQQQEVPQPRAPYPAPPPFWKHFTKSNISRLHALESQPQGRPEKLPLELTYLRPPPPPRAGHTQQTHYTIFNQAQPLNTSTPALPPAELLLFNPDKPVDHAVLLTKLTKSMLLNFLELITVLAHDPVAPAAEGGGGTSAVQDKIEDIRRLVLNAHVVINMYRPVQAREAVREMLEARLEEGKREMEEMEAKKAEVQEYLKEVRRWKEKTRQDEAVGTDGNGVSGEVKKEAVDGVDKAEIEQARKLWKIVHEIASE
ncbi:hypothetical protein DV737_g1243, partial [Chaetothyriales sp. CBS 132003]